MPTRIRAQVDVRAADRTAVVCAGDERGPGLERRIGDRRPVSEVAMAWPRPQRGRFGRTRGHTMADDAAEVVDLSVTGALVRAPVDQLLVEGSVVGVRLDGMAARVVVRRVTPEGDGMARYGVEFVDPTQALRAHLHSHVVPEDATPGWGWV